MVSEWNELPLEECMDAIIDYRGKTPKKTASGVPLITAKIIKGGSIQPVTEFIAEEDYESWMRRGIPESGDIVMTTEAPLGEVAQLDGRRVALAQRVITLRGKAGLLDNTFLKYLLKSHKVQHQLDGRATGTTVKGIKQSELRQVVLGFPSFEEQKAIAHILGTLDDKIELNRQMNDTLDAMAQASFKSWFVDFDPVIDNALAAGNPIPEPLQARAEARIALGEQRKPLPEAIRKQFPDSFTFDEDMGWVPEGWPSKTLDDVCEKITDGSHSSPKSVEAGFPMASVKDMHNWGIDLSSCRHINKVDYDQLVKNGCKPEASDVLIAKDGSYLKHIFVVEKEIELVLLSSIAILRPNKQINPHILSFTLKRPDVLEKMENYVSGAVLQRIILKDFRRFPILLPPNKLQERWFDIYEAGIKRCWLNIHENESLRRLRDSLVPKLLSGQLRVSEAEKQIAEAI